MVIFGVYHKPLYVHQPTIAGWWFQPLWKIWKSVGMISNPIYGKIKNGNQTTNQPLGIWDIYDL